MADADTALRHLGRATLVGRGLGAYVALLLAGARPTGVRGAILRDGLGLAGGGPRPGTPQIAFPNPTASLERVAKTTRSARDWPWALQWPGDSEWRLARYIHDCTNADDRLLVTWAAPEFYFFSKRPFAGREGPLFPVLRRPDSFEPQILEAWKQKRVPIVLTNDESYREFATTFPGLATHLAEAYTEAGKTEWDERPSITVHVDRNRMVTGRDTEFGLPCFSGTPVASTP
jgi:pimeloyl-ACP methyl ester carboxylesterase